MDADLKLSLAFVQEHPAEACRVLERHPAQEVMDLIEGADPGVVATVLENAMPTVASGYLVRLTPDQAAQALQALSTDVAVTLLRSLEPGPRNHVLETLPDDIHLAYERLLAYPDGTAGALMNPFAFVLPEDLTVGEALRQVRKVGRKRFHFPYVVDRKQRLVGLLTVRALMLARPEDPLSQVMHREVLRLPATATGAHLERVPGWRAYQSLPVVDEAGVLIGAVPYERLTQLSSQTPRSSLPGAVADSFVALAAAYWTCLAQLATQTVTLLGSLTRTRPIE